jgi:hypothetical protein
MKLNLDIKRRGVAILTLRPLLATPEKRKQENGYLYYKSLG